MEAVKEKVFTGIRPFKAEDMLFIMENGIKEFGLKILDSQQIRELAEAREVNSQCLTAVVNDEVIGCGGIDLMWEGVGEVWLILSYEVNKCPIESYKVIKDGLEKLIEDNNLWRVQGWCRRGFNEAHTLFQHLGFKVEGIARKYAADGVDCFLYAKVKE